MKNIFRRSMLWACLTTFALPAYSMDEEKALSLIEKFADHVCQTAPIKSKSAQMELSGNANAELKGLLKKIAGLGFAGTADYRTGESEGVLQKDLAGLLAKTVDCRKEVASKLIDRLLTKSGMSQGGGSKRPEYASSPTLQPQEEKFLALINTYQFELGVRKLIVQREDGKVYFEQQQQLHESDFNFLSALYGSANSANAVLFEDLVQSISPVYVRVSPELRLNNPYVISITKAGQLYLEQRGKSTAERRLSGGASTNQNTNVQQVNVDEVKGGTVNITQQQGSH